MAVFKCKMCGGTLDITEGMTVCECEYCGSTQTVPQLDDDRRANLYDRANHFRRNNEYDKADRIYEQILNEDPTDAEAYWSLVLCRYGIEYVEDPATHKRVPTVNRAQYTSIFDDDNYKSAIEYADTYQRTVYDNEAKAINEIQKGILAISQKEEPFDVFICYKETDNSGRRTRDSVLANDLYHQLIQEGFKVFFSRITLEDKLGTAYEPYIFAALNSAKVMVVLGTKPEYFNAVWVKNEWSRYLALVNKSGGKKVLIPAYRDMDPYDLPEEFSHLQAQDMSKLGFMQDLIRGIKKIARKDEPKSESDVKQTIAVSSGNANSAALLKRVKIFLEDGDWKSADEYCEKVLDIDPENAEAYVGKLMAELHVRRREDLADQREPFDNKNYFKKAIRFADEKLRSELNQYITHIVERNKNEIYDRAVRAMNSAKTESEYKEAAEIFYSILGWKDADALAEQCLEKAEIARKDAIYSDAVRSMNWASTENGYKSSAESFATIRGWRDADTLAEQCREKAETARKDEIYSKAVASMKAAKSETEYKETTEQFKSIPEWKDADKLAEQCLEKAEICRLESERKAEELRIAAEKAAKKRKKIITIVLTSVAVCIAFVIVLTTVIIPNVKYNTALDLYNAGKYEEAITAFTALSGYKDSAEQITKCETALRDSNYNAAVDLYNAGKYDEAITAFTALNGYKDSAEQITKCETAIKDSKYNAAVELYNAGKYEEAITAFTALNGYKDSSKKADECLPLIQKSRLTNVKVGSTIEFGYYEQDDNTSNGKEEIEWQVLAVEDNKALVISKYALDAQEYNSTYTDTTWEECSLRRWLNGTFYNAAFAPALQDIIVSSNVIADENPKYNTSQGDNSTDKAFLLSITEVNKYFSSDSDRQCRGTAYCYANGTYSNKYWWLRSSARDSCHAAFVYFNSGHVANDGYWVNTKLAVRPALWINLGS